MAGDGINWNASVRIEKFSPDQVAAATEHYGYEPSGDELRAHAGEPEHGVTEEPGNLLTTVGLNLITELIEGGGGTPFAHADAIIGVGAGTATALVGDTALTDDNTANAWYQQADSTYPQQSGGVITVQCTFASGNANFAWQEWCAATGSGGITPGTHLSAVATSPVMLNHKVQSLGTKASGGSWVLTATITLS